MTLSKILIILLTAITTVASTQLDAMDQQPAEAQTQQLFQPNSLQYECCRALFFLKNPDDNTYPQDTKLFVKQLNNSDISVAMSNTIQELQQIEKNILQSAYFIIDIKEKLLDGINLVVQTLQPSGQYKLPLISLGNNCFASSFDDATYDDKAILMWALNSDSLYEYQQTFQGLCPSVHTLTRLDENVVASSAYCEPTKLWALNSDGLFECQQELDLEHRLKITALLKLDNNWIASGSGDTTIKIWAPNSDNFYACQQILQEHMNSVSTLINLNNGSFASSAYDSTIKIWVLNAENSYDCQQTLTDHTGAIFSLINLSNGCFASASQDKTIKIWEQNSDGLFECRQTLTDHFDDVYILINLSNGYFASASYNTIKIWAPYADNLYKCQHTLRQIRTNTIHKARIFSLINLDNGYIASAACDRIILFDPLYDLSIAQIILVKALQQYSDNHNQVTLHNDWADIFDTLPERLKRRFTHTLQYS